MNFITHLQRLVIITDQSMKTHPETSSSFCWGRERSSEAWFYVVVFGRPSYDHSKTGCVIFSCFGKILHPLAFNHASSFLVTSFNLFRNHNPGLCWKAGQILLAFSFDDTLVWSKYGSFCKVKKINILKIQVVGEANSIKF